ncbi:hypothetical protein SAMN04489832_0188 [Micromonospora cremea]|uniref:Uncharacterized protein n=1 Tax=Micromonospora cremea TaxID=709881 RepID=A0A1N5TJ64_9ACTN|nr:hypothetical protein SAMN04489832_0188 [Micromonospora cremea]
MPLTRLIMRVWQTYDVHLLQAERNLCAASGPVAQHGEQPAE